MPYNKAMSVTNGKGQPTDLLAISKTKNNKNVSWALKMLQGGRVGKNRPRAGNVKKWEK